MSPILIRPVREQLEHDRVIRILQLRLRRKFEVAVNVGAEQVVPVKVGRLPVYPDLVLSSTRRGHKLAGLVEVETAESVNHLEAMAQWAHFSRVRVPFSLYVPAGSADMARRLCADNQVVGAEIWSYHTIGSQVRFTLVHRAPAAQLAARAGGRRARSASGNRTRRATRAGAKSARRRAPAGRRARSHKQKRK